MNVIQAIWLCSRCNSGVCGCKSCSNIVDLEIGDTVINSAEEINEILQKHNIIEINFCYVTRNAFCKMNTTKITFLQSNKRNYHYKCLSDYTFSSLDGCDFNSTRFVIVNNIFLEEYKIFAPSTCKELTMDNGKDDNNATWSKIEQLKFEGKKVLFHMKHFMLNMKVLIIIFSLFDYELIDFYGNIYELVKKPSVKPAIKNINM